MVVAQDLDLDLNQPPPPAIREQDGEQNQQHEPSHTPLPWENTPSGNREQPSACEAASNVSRPPSRLPGPPAVPGPGDLGEPLNLGDDDGNVWNGARRQPSEEKEKEKESSSLLHVPDVLRPGGNRLATNPHLKRKPLPQASGALVTGAFSKLDIHHDAGTSTNPWQLVTESESGSTRHPSPQPRPVTADGLESDPWAATDKPLLTQPSRPATSPVLISLSPEDDVSSAWKEEARPIHDRRAVPEHPSTSASTAISPEILEEQNIWDDFGAIDKGKAKASGLAAASDAGQASRIDDWSLIDADTLPNSPEISHTDVDPGHDSEPPLPSRSKGLKQKWIPSRPPVDAKAETYQIKNIQWHDPSSAHNPRTSPILIQNENGPCPLVALVNALTMTTPSDSSEKTLVETLRPKERISLDLLLNAVLNELMSRRTSSDKVLPDVSDLYAFLQSLHTGMNVNPRFVPTPEMVNAYKRTSLTNLDPTERAGLIPGTFENTMEMSLYAAFSIPLVHGWLPAQSDPAYSAMERRRAASYEDVQNLLFHEEELTNKLSDDQGLTEDEQELYQDIMTIKMFLDLSATQLTAWGIEVIGKAMRPGTFSILFRNDHFSTLYCHPQTLKLLSLVTDAGLHKHKEVVWESLVDVNGEHTEFLSGDCRVVRSGGEADADGGGSSVAGSARDRTTVQGHRGKNRQHDAEAATLSPSEQEDRDLALALQLQEEEDQRHRDAQLRRRRESALSEQFIEQQGHRPSPVSRDQRRTSQNQNQNLGITPERRSSSSLSTPVTASGTTHSHQPSMSRQPHQPQQQRHQQQPLPLSQPQPQQQPQQQGVIQQQTVRPLVPARRPGGARHAEPNGEDAPPSYEQAAQDPLYVPSMGHANHSQSSTAMPTPNMGLSSRRQDVSHGDTGSARNRECVVM
ncbi:hypothetical protein E4U42_002949 [Claviceps africana]|uniref:MINDY deubiquitinase domain-containing protein n=1 Tax=Claviceps africana TaxID=83212 RepID=A0A8K0J839_9HYPO|nr:hypothetical protein E4U42_002949 [Claviceps africana]